MTEQEWLACTDPDSMLSFLGKSGNLSERKGRLFCVACCRKVWHLLKDERSHKAIEVVERWVDGTACREELAAAHHSAWEAWGTPARTSASDASTVEWHVGIAVNAANHAAWAAVGGSRADERKAQAGYLRCIVGNPFRSPQPSDPSWLTAWVVAIASRVYDERDFGVMPVLADALEEAGCDNERLLSHLRGLGPHCRGCHVLDWLLDRR